MKIQRNAKPESSTNLPYQVNKKGVLTRWFEPSATVVIPEGVTAISVQAFPKAVGRFVKELVVPESVKEIPNGAFSSMVNLESFEGNIVNPRAFLGSGLEEEVYRECVQDDLVICDGEVIKCLDTVSRTITIPSSATRIGESAFAGCTQLKHPSAVNADGFKILFHIII